MRKLNLFVLLLAALVIGIVPAMAQTGRASITLITPTAPVAVDATFDVVIQVSTGGAPIDAAAAYLNFDPAIFQVERIIPGTALPIFLQSGIDNVTGEINFAAGQLPPAFPSGTFTLATVTLRTLAPTDAATLTLVNDLARDTDVVAAGESVLGAATGSLVTVSLDAPIAPENLTAPVIVQQASVSGSEAVAPIAPEAVVETLALEPLVAPVTVDTAAPEAWAADAGWTLAPAQDGTSAWGFAAGSSAASASLRLAYPIDLSAVIAPAVSFSYSLSGSAAGVLEISANGGATWTTLATLAPTTDVNSAAIDLSAYASGIINLRFSAAGLAADGGLTVGALSVVEAILPE